MPAHSTYTPEVGDKICERVAMGESITDICLDSDMPSRVTVWRWLKEVPEFETNHVRAREAQADVMDEKIMTTADACTAETAAADRVKIGAYQWRASRLNSRRYGDKQEHLITARTVSEVIAPDATAEQAADAYRRLIGG